MVFRKSFVAVTVALLVSAFVDSATAQTPEDEAMMQRQPVVNNSRIGRLRALMPMIIPDCKITVSETEISEFFRFWRQTASEEVAELEKEDRPDYTSPRSIGPIQIGATVPIRTLVTVDTHTPGALEAAKEQIEIWHLYRCVDAEFHGNKYSGAYGYDGVIRAGNVQTTFARVPGTQIAMMIPSMNVVEPIEALGRFFHAADERHLLTFQSDDERSYFFSRYDSDYFVNLRESDATKRWFQTPPWATSPK